MIHKLYAAAAFISLATLFSCAGNSDKDYIDKSLISPATENKTAQPALTNTTTTVNTNSLPNTTAGNTTITPGNNTLNLNTQNKTVNLAPQNMMPQNVLTQAPAAINTQQAQQKTAPGMNPPHGEPNHRCDIAVGAPLNSPPGKTAPAPTVVTTQQAPATINAQQAQQTVTAPGMNPPHGQTNHRCDIAIGAPLNSPPGPTATPAKKDSAKN